MSTPSRCTATVARGLAALLLALGLQSRAAAATPVAPVVIVAGGYATCLAGESPTNGRVYNVARALAYELPYDISQIPLVTSCFSLPVGGSVTPVLRYAFPNTFERTSSVDAYIATLSAWLALPQLQGRPVVIYGQSHGGWLVLRIVQELKTRLPQGVALPAMFLATVDPIDYLGCTPAENDRLMRAVMSRQGYQSPCTRAPSLSTYNLLDGSPLPEWHNIYQDRCAFLHSGQLASALNEWVIPTSTLTFTKRSELDQVLAGQGSDFAWMSNDLRDNFLLWLVQRRPELDFTMHSGLPDFTLTTLKNRMRVWYTRLAGM